MMTLNYLTNVKRVLIMQKAQKIGISDSKINIPREKKLKKNLKMKEKVVEGKIYRRKMRVKMKKGNDANRNER